ncbi:MAG: FAD-dependent monooxygenase [Brevundimonas sp.]|nr:FAD-dependent monooxygenase [Brevundimonas sp.]
MASAWLNFPRVACSNWRDGKVILLGDAAHTAHFSIGSGTKLAFEDAISLASALTGGDDLDAALAAYEAERRIEVLKAAERRPQTRPNGSRPSTAMSASNPSSSPTAC